jgi:hypothetical protein
MHDPGERNLEILHTLAVIAKTSSDEDVGKAA